MTAATERHERLEGYLLQDPDNSDLLRETFDAALACGLQDRAQELLHRGRRSAMDPVVWTLRQARLHLARHELEAAARVLEPLHARGEMPVATHDLAWVHFTRRDFIACRTLLQPWLEREDLPLALAGAFQVLWLRASHQLGEVEPACDRALEWQAAGRLSASAQGVAALAAIDAQRFAQARAWSHDAAWPDAPVAEAVVARATVCLAQGDAAQSIALLDPVLAQHPQDGRSLSLRGMARLRAADLPPARADLEAATRTLARHIGTWHALGWTCLLQGDRAAARQAFEQALALDRNFAESHGALGLLQALEGEAQRAREHLDIADRLDPRNVTGRYARAVLAGEAGDLEWLQALAMRLFDRPGLLGGMLGDEVVRALRR